MSSKASQSPDQHKILIEKSLRLLEGGNLTAAEHTFARVEDTARMTAQGLYLQARIHEAHGNNLLAIKAYEKACNLPDSVPEHFLDLASLMRRVGSIAQVRDVLRIAFRRFPDDSRISASLGAALLEEGHISQARKLVEFAIRCSGNKLLAHEVSASIYRAIGQPTTALAHLEEALVCSKELSGKKSKNKQTELSLLIAETARETGDLDRSEKLLRKVIRSNPLTTRAWLILSDVIRFKENSPEIARMTNILSGRDGSLSNSNRVDLEFAMGKAWMDAGQPNKAMQHLQAGNSLHRSQISFDGKAVANRLQNYADCFDQSMSKAMRQQDSEKPGKTPKVAFIVGMPRSGTTLIEQILSSHNKVFGAGELTTLPRLKNAVLGKDFPDTPGSFQRVKSIENLTSLANAYLKEVLQHLPPSDDGYHYILDKMPGNFMFCGLIAMAMPHARIIHCRRNPIDTCLSCYSKYFVSGQSFSYNLTELGNYYRSYDTLMHHWRQVLPPNQFIEVEYESVVEDLEHEAKRLLDFLELPWDPALLEFHASDRAVRTASANQVRKPIYRSSVERWRPYEKELAPLFEALGINPA
ncbi:MAG: tetratricopeptide repeat-containing sulfotransferase family protein [Thalassospira sp.]|uniref:tetratricopeptide repeat-containing sulfotransferase family protein n=1 Tax=Thalassospira sp. TaxID=1912094 RepID=UPI003A8950C9